MTTTAVTAATVGAAAASRLVTTTLCYVVLAVVMMTATTMRDVRHAACAQLQGTTVFGANQLFNPFARSQRQRAEVGPVVVHPRGVLFGDHQHVPPPTVAIDEPIPADADYWETAAVGNAAGDNDAAGAAAGEVLALPLIGVPARDVEAEGRFRPAAAADRSGGDGNPGNNWRPSRPIDGTRRSRHQHQHQPPPQQRSAALIGHRSASEQAATPAEHRGEPQPAESQQSVASQRDWRLPSVTQFNGRSRSPPKRRPSPSRLAVPSITSRFSKNLNEQALKEPEIPADPNENPPSPPRNSVQLPPPVPSHPREEPPAPPPPDLEEDVPNEREPIFSNSAGFVNLEDLYAHVQAVKHSGEAVEGETRQKLNGAEVVSKAEARDLKDSEPKSTDSSNKFPEPSLPEVHQPENASFEVVAEDEPLFLSRGPAPVGVTVDGISSPAAAAEAVGLPTTITQQSSREAQEFQQFAEEHQQTPPHNQLLATISAVNGNKRPNALRRRPASVIRRLVVTTPPPSQPSEPEINEQVNPAQNPNDPSQERGNNNHLNVGNNPEPQPTTIPSNVEVSVVDIPLSTDIPFTKILADKIKEETEKVRLKNLALTQQREDKQQETQVEPAHVLIESPKEKTVMAVAASVSSATAASPLGEIIILSSVQTSKSISSSGAEDFTTNEPSEPIESKPSSTTTTTERTKWAPPKPLPPRKPNSGILSPLLKLRKDAGSQSGDLEDSEDPETTTSSIPVEVISEKTIDAGLQKILASFKAEDLSKILPPGVKLVTLPSQAPPPTTTPTATSSTTTTSYPTVVRRDKKLPKNFAGKDDQAGAKVGDLLEGLFGPGGHGGRGNDGKRKKLPSQKTVGDLLGEIDFGSASGIDPNLLPKDFTPPPTEAPSSTSPTTRAPVTALTKKTEASGFGNLFKNVELNDLKSLLPPGYRLEPSTTTTVKPVVVPKQIEEFLKSLQVSGLNESLLASGLTVLNSSPLPISTATTPAPTTTTVRIGGIVFKDIFDTGFLPPGYKPGPEKVESSDTSAPSPKVDLSLAAIASLLPPGFNLQQAGATSTSESTTTSTAATSTSTASTTTRAFLIFPGGSRTRKPVTEAPSEALSSLKPLQITFSAPRRPEFTGWPTSSTEPVPRPPPRKNNVNAVDSNEVPSADFDDGQPSSSSSTTTTTPASTTTYRVTTTTYRATTPGVCGSECRLGATIRIVGGADWTPALWDKTTKVYQNLAKELEEELDAVYRNSLLADWYDRVEIEAFSPGSVIVDYVVWLRGLENREVDTGQLKKVFYKAVDGIHRSSPPSAGSGGGGPNGNRGRNATGTAATAATSTDRRSRQKSLGGKSASGSIPDRITLGAYTLDPFYTDFVVLKESAVRENDDDEDEYELPLPQWAIAVIVISSASLMFVVAFGITMLVNKKKASKKRSNKLVPLSDDMLHELSKDHMGSPLGLPMGPSGHHMHPAAAMASSNGMGHHHHHHHHPPAAGVHAHHHGHGPPPSYHTPSSNMAMADDSSVGNEGGSGGGGRGEDSRGRRDRERAERERAAADRDTSDVDESYFDARNKYPGFAGRVRPAKGAKGYPGDHPGIYDSWRTDWSGFSPYRNPPPLMAPSNGHGGSSGLGPDGYRMYPRKPPDYDTDF